MCECVEDLDSIKSEVKIQLLSPQEQNTEEISFLLWLEIHPVLPSIHIKVILDLVFCFPRDTKTSHSLLSTKILTLHIYLVVMFYEENGIY